MQAEALSNHHLKSELLRKAESQSFDDGQGSDSLITERAIIEACSILHSYHAL